MYRGAWLAAIPQGRKELETTEAIWHTHSPSHPINDCEYSIFLGKKCVF